MPPVRLLDSGVEVDARTALGDGYHGILRYLFNGPNAMTCLSRREVEGYAPFDFGVGSLAEKDAAAAAGGKPRGESDALLYVASQRGVGAPEDTAIFYAVDTDPAGIGIANVVAYYGGVAPRTRGEGFLVGGYVGALAENACLDAGVLDRAMRPAASSWSDGAVPRRLDIDQQVLQVTIGGNDYDVDLEYDDAGLWTASGLWPSRPKQKEKDIVDLFIVRHPTRHAENVCVWGSKAFPIPDEPSQAWLEAQAKAQGQEKSSYLGAGVAEATVGAPSEPPQSLIGVLLG